MTTADDARETLRALDSASKTTQRARPSRSVPLLVLSLVVAGSMPFYIQAVPGPGLASGTAQLSSQGWVWLQPLFGHSPWVTLYWLVALPLAYVFIAWWLYRAAQRSGVRLRGRALVYTGLALFVVLIIPGLLHRWFDRIHPPLLPGDLTLRGLMPLLTIGVALIVWAIAERSIALSITAVVYIAASLLASLYNLENLTYRLGWTVDSRFTLVLNVGLCAVVLLLASLGNFVAERVQRR